MDILLIGEYSRLHNSLKEGLLAIGHRVVLTSSGDSFKNFPSDHLFKPEICKTWFGQKIRNAIFKFIKIDLEEIERGIRFYFLLKHFKKFDVVQLINERPIQTMPFMELYLLKKIFKNNNKVFLLSSGVDRINVEYLIKNPSFKSILQPYFADKSLEKHYEYVFTYLKKKHLKTHQFVYENCRGIIASDMDYALPLAGNKKFISLVPNPVNVDIIKSEKLKIDNKIIIFLGINRGNDHQKGISFFEKALLQIKVKYPQKVEIITAENLPYKDYISHYNRCHILLDQTFAYDQGYNALEAMAKGKVVFTGAEAAFENHYKLTKKVAINAVANVDYLVEKLSHLIENPNEIPTISENAKNFILQYHDYKKVAKTYADLWVEN